MTKSDKTDTYDERYRYPLCLAHFSSSSLRSIGLPLGKIKCRSPSCISTSSPDPTNLHPGCEQFRQGFTPSVADTLEFGAGPVRARL